MFFCKVGKHRHDKTGFYWGVPSKTSNGYEWATQFLKIYESRRRSKVGKEMMGMIFRLDNHKYLSTNEVNALTIRAVESSLGKITDNRSSPAESSEPRGRYNWKALLPTIAKHLKLAKDDTLAPGSRRDKEAKGSEVTTALDRAEKKEGMSRAGKLICVKVIAHFGKCSIKTCDEISEEQWETISIEAKAEVLAIPRGISRIWRNPDVTAPGRGSREKEPRATFPKQVDGVKLAPSNRSGQRYCAGFQSRNCQAPMLRGIA